MLITDSKLLIAEGNSCLLPTDTGGGLTQPWATVIAATIAIFAASIAFAGVVRTTNETRKENRRKEKLERVLSGLNQVTHINRAVLQLTEISDPHARTEYQAQAYFGSTVEGWDNELIGLRLFGLGDIAKEMNQHVLELSAEWDKTAKNPEITIDRGPLDRKYDELQDAVQRVIAQLDR